MVKGLGFFRAEGLGFKLTASGSLLIEYPVT